MATNSNSKLHLKKSFLLIFVLMVWLPHTKSLNSYTQSDTCIYGKEEPLNCGPIGSYNITYERDDCPTREVCFLDVNKRCYPGSPETVCAPGLICSCFECMNCLNGKCNLKICPRPQGNHLLKRWISSNEKNRLGLYNNGGDVARPKYYYYQQ